MKKRQIMVIALTALCLIMTACGGKKKTGGDSAAQQTNDAEQTEESSDEAGGEMMDTLGGYAMSMDGWSLTKDQNLSNKVNAACRAYLERNNLLPENVRLTHEDPDREPQGFVDGSASQTERHDLRYVWEEMQAATDNEVRMYQFFYSPEEQQNSGSDEMVYAFLLDKTELKGAMFCGKGSSGFTYYNPEQRTEVDLKADFPDWEKMDTPKLSLDEAVDWVIDYYSKETGDNDVVVRDKYASTKYRLNDRSEIVSISGLYLVREGMEDSVVCYAHEIDLIKEEVSSLRIHLQDGKEIDEYHIPMR